MRDIDVTLIIPTYNERANVGPLIAELSHAMDGHRWEALFVDDSTDGTDTVLARLSETDEHIRLVHRAENRGGLAGAVVEGFKQARGTYACVLDADLQHPPALVPQLIAAAAQSSADLVIASRYVPGGSDGGLAGPLRRAISMGLRELTRLAFPVRLARVSDPLSGFFLLRRSLVEGVPLRPFGYKILLEVLVRCDWRTVQEVPYAFRPRFAGDSKADLPQGLRFLRHLARLIWDRSPLLHPRYVSGHVAREAESPPMLRIEV